MIYLAFMLERGFKAAMEHPENKEAPTRLSALLKAQADLLDAGVVDPPGNDNRKSEFIFDHNLFTYYPERGRIVEMKDGRIVNLTSTENRVFRVMAQKPDEISTFRDFDLLWSNNHTHALLKKYIERLREKIGDKKIGDKFILIQSVHGVGYIFSTRVDPQQENHRTTASPEVTLYENGFHNNSHPGYSPVKRTMQESNSKAVYRHSSGLTYFPERNSVVMDGTESFLTRVENRVLELLVQNENKLVRHSDLDEAVSVLLDGGRDVQGPITRHISSLRRKIGDKKIQGKHNFTVIRSVHGQGYILVNHKP